MAATIARAEGVDLSGATKSTTRLGSEYAHAEANTWRTTADVFTRHDGSGAFTLSRNGRIIVTVEYDAEELDRIPAIAIDVRGGVDATYLNENEGTKEL